MLVFIVVSLVAATYLFAADRAHRKNDPMDQAQRGVLTAASPNSFTRQPRLDAALAKIKAKVPADARVSLLNISPVEVTATLVRPDGATIYASVSADLKAQSRDTSIGSEAKGVAISQIDTAIPARLLARADTKLKLRPAFLERITYGTPYLASGSGYWNLSYTRPVLHNDATAAADGTDLRLQGEPDAAARAATRKAEAAMRAASRHATQANKAATEAQKRIQQQIREAQRAAGITP
jgi:hypothetical protein